MLRHLVPALGGGSTYSRTEPPGAPPDTSPVRELVSGRRIGDRDLGRGQERWRRVADDTVVDDLARAAEGEQASWDRLIDRYGGLVWSVARSYRLSADDAADVSQTTWLRLVEHLGRLREPERLSAWLVTTAKRECLRVIRSRSRDRVLDLEGLARTTPDEPPPDSRLIALERSAVLMEAVGPPRRRLPAPAARPHGEPAAVVRAGQRGLGDADRVHRPHARAVPGAAAKTPRRAWYQSSRWWLCLGRHPSRGR